MAKFCDECGQKLNPETGKCDKCGNVGKIKRLNEKLQEEINSFKQTDDEGRYKFFAFFSDIFKKHDKEETEEMFTCGTTATTPDIKKVSGDVPKPWIYTRVLFMFIIAFALMYFNFFQMKNSTSFPAMSIIAAAVVPITLLILAFEMNAYRNVSLFDVIKTFFIGGALSLCITLVYSTLGDWTNGLTVSMAIFVGVVEEISKVIAIIIFIKRTPRVNGILDGMLIGAAVGAGFTVFESAGYIYNFSSYGVEAISQVMWIRIWCAFSSHTIYGAMCAFALMYAKGFNKLDKKVYNSAKFLNFMLVPIVIHAVWDMPIAFFNDKTTLKILLFTALCWIILIYYYKAGYKQVAQLKSKNINKERK